MDIDSIKTVQEELNSDEMNKCHDHFDKSVRKYNSRCSVVTLTKVKFRM